jgi:hypothetical protein
MSNGEKEQIQKLELQPLENKGLSRGDFLRYSLLLAFSCCGGASLATALLKASFQEPDQSPNVPLPTATPKPPVNPPPIENEIPPTATPIPRETQTRAEAVTPSPIETPKRNIYEIGGINFVDQEKPLGISYPEDFEGKRFVNFNNLQILVSDNTGNNYETFISQFGNRVFVYHDSPSGTFVLNLHDGWLLRNHTLLEAEPLRRLIEGELRNSYPQDVIDDNLKKIIGHPFFFSQNGHASRFTVAQAKRMDSQETQAFLYNPEELSRTLNPITNPENSFLLLICSGRQPNEPNEDFPGRFVFVLQYSPQ